METQAIDIKKALIEAIKENLSGFDLSNSFKQRSVGDKIEDDCAEIVKRLFPDNYLPARSARSTEDFTLKFGENKTYVDIKTHFVQETEGFSMPNLISVDKLRKILSDEKLALAYVFIDYTRDAQGYVSIEKVEVKYVWELDWSMLGIGALGKGQLQIKNANKELVFTDIAKQEWLEILRSKVSEFYVRQIEKIKREQAKWKL